MGIKIAHMSQIWERPPKTVTAVSIKATFSSLRMALPNAERVV